MLSRDEMKELLANHAPVIYHNERNGTDTEYKYINALITRCDAHTNKFMVHAELMDINNNSVIVVPIKDVYKKD